MGRGPSPGTGTVYGLSYLSVSSCFPRRKRAPHRRTAGAGPSLKSQTDCWRSLKAAATSAPWWVRCSARAEDASMPASLPSRAGRGHEYGYSDEQCGLPDSPHSYGDVPQGRVQRARPTAASTGAPRRPKSALRASLSARPATLVRPCAGYRRTHSWLSPLGCPLHQTRSLIRPDRPDGPSCPPCASPG
jgi:hypothetical protein